MVAKRGCTISSQENVQIEHWRAEMTTGAVRQLTSRITKHSMG